MDPDDVGGMVGKAMDVMGGALFSALRGKDPFADGALGDLMKVQETRATALAGLSKEEILVGMLALAHEPCGAPEVALLVLLEDLNFMSIDLGNLDTHRVSPEDGSPWRMDASWARQAVFVAWARRLEAYNGDSMAWVQEAKLEAVLRSVAGVLLPSALNDELRDGNTLSLTIGANERCGFDGKEIDHPVLRAWMAFKKRRGHTQLSNELTLFYTQLSCARRRCTRSRQGVWRRCVLTLSCGRRV
jgi:hypothetical protein